MNPRFPAIATITNTSPNAMKKTATTSSRDESMLSHVITNNKSPPKYFELDSASCRAAKELPEGTNQVSLGQLLTAQSHFPRVVCDNFGNVKLR